MAVIRTLLRLPQLLYLALQILLEDPINGFTQAYRRLPLKVRRFFANRIRPLNKVPTLSAFVYSMVDETERARAALERAPQSRLADSLRIRHKLPLSSHATPEHRSRELWELGDLQGALKFAPPNSAFARYLRSQQILLGPQEFIKVGSTPRQTRNGESLKVLHVLTNSLPWTTSGYAIRSHQILTHITQNGAAVEAITRLSYPLNIGRPQAPVRDVIAGVTYHRAIPAIPPRLPHRKAEVFAQALIKHASKHNCSLLHTTTNYENGSVVRAAAKALGVPWVYEMRGELENTWVSRFPPSQQTDAMNSQRYRLMRAKETALAQDADAVVVLSNTQKESLIERGIAPAKIHVMPNAVDSKFLHFERQKLQSRRNLKLPATSDAFLVGTVSALVDYEGLDVLLAAVKIARTGGHNVQCVITGDGTSLPTLVKRAADLGISEFVHFMGKVPAEEVLPYYDVLDAMVIPRRDTEVTRAVTPVKGLQAMALGIPIIASELPALTEVSTASGQGISVQPEDPQALAQAIVHLSGAPHLAAELGKAGKEAASLRTWEALSQKYIELYKILTPERNG